ncbi:MAG: Cof-type HAD-IIB family hydrolase [Vulcanimicrobiaceae bacterium]
MIRLVALDLDGTLISASLQVSERVKEAIARARVAGVNFTMVTGRMFAAALPFARAVGIDGPIVCYQGAATYVVATGERLFHYPLPPPVTAEVLKTASSDGVRALGYYDDMLYADGNDAYTKEYTGLARVEVHIVPSLQEYFRDRPSTKVVCITDIHNADAYVERLKKMLGERAYVTRSQPQFVEVIDSGVNKGRALAAIAELYGVPTGETMAVGDSWNDVPLLEAAGFSVAMGTAPQELLAMADAVVAGVERDGVAEALERFVLGAEEVRR